MKRMIGQGVRNFLSHQDVLTLDYTVVSFIDWFSVLLCQVTSFIRPTVVTTYFESALNFIRLILFSFVYVPSLSLIQI